MLHRHRRTLTALLTVLLQPLELRADPLHPLADDGYWHHDSNFIFPATIGAFSRVGAPQDVDGSSTVVAYYARRAGDDRLVITIDVFPVADGPAPAAAADETTATFVRTLEHAGWRIVVHATLSDAGNAGEVEALVHALRLERLGAVDTRCPNAGCGT